MVQGLHRLHEQQYPTQYKYTNVLSPVVIQSYPGGHELNELEFSQQWDVSTKVSTGFWWEIFNFDPFPVVAQPQPQGSWYGQIVFS